MNVRTHLLACLWSFVFCSVAFAGPLDKWTWRNPVTLTNGAPLQNGPHAPFGMTYANGNFVGVGDAVVVALSSDGTNWIEYATATSNKLNGIGCLNGLYVAVGNGGAVESSADGIHWALGSSGTTSNLSCVTCSSGLFVAAGSSVVITSTNATNWSSAGISGLSGATSVTYGSAGFLAVNADKLVYASANGFSWASQQLYNGPYYVRNGVTNFMQHEVVSHANGLYCVTGQRAISGSPFVYRAYFFTSVDGSNWTTDTNASFTASTGYHNFSCLIPCGANVLAIGMFSDRVYPFLFDGSAWTAAGYINTSLPFLPYTGAYGNGVFVLPTSYSPLLFTSTNGTNWVNQETLLLSYTGPTGTFLSIAASNGISVVVSASGAARSTNSLLYFPVTNSPPLNSVVYFKTNFVGVGSGGTIFVSSDGVAWTQKNSGTTSNLRCVTASSGLLVAVGDNGAIQTSTTGNVWSSRLSGSSLSLYGVTYSNGQFVVVGQLGTVLTSPDGINWTGQDCGSLTNLLSVTHGPAGFLAVGKGGTALTSLDGVSWTQQFPGTATNLESATFGNGYYLVAGDGGFAKTSPDGVNWTARNLGAASGQNFLGSAFLNSRFVVVGAAGAVIESDVVAPLFDLNLQRVASGNKLTAFAPVGTSFRIQACSNLVSAAWSNIATFNNAAAVSIWTNPVSGNQQFFRCVSP